MVCRPTNNMRRRPAPFRQSNLPSKIFTLELPSREGWLRKRRDFFVSHLSASHWNSVGVGTSLTETCRLDSAVKRQNGYLSGIRNIQPGLNDEQVERQQRQREILKRDLEQQVSFDHLLFLKRDFQITEKRARIAQRRAEEEARNRREEEEIEAYLQKQRQEQTTMQLQPTQQMSPVIIPKPQLKAPPSDSRQTTHRPSRPTGAQ